MAPVGVAQTETITRRCFRNDPLLERRRAWPDGGSEASALAFTTSGRSTDGGNAAVDNNGCGLRRSQIAMKNGVTRIGNVYDPTVTIEGPRQSANREWAGHLYPAS